MNSKLKPNSHIKDRNDLPEYIIDPDDILFIGILGVNGNSGARLDPDIPSILLYPSIVLGNTLSLIQYQKSLKTNMNTSDGSKCTYRYIIQHAISSKAPYATVQL